MILDVQLWELGAQRLHQGLSETIHVNTLTDVRKFKNDLISDLHENDGHSGELMILFYLSFVILISTK